MTDTGTELEVGRNLEERLVSRRAIETALQTGWRRSAHRGVHLLRDHIAASVLGTALQIMGLYDRGVRNALDPVIRHVLFEFEDLPESFHGFRILHLADLHVDGVDRLAEIVAERLGALPADLCVMTGDYRFTMEGPCEAVYSGMATILSRVRAHHGVLAILGNHDESEIAVELESLGVRMLINEAVEITRGDDSLWMIGVDDPHHYGCDDLPGALESVPPDAFKVVLAHSPEMFNEAAAAQISLYLCGHTHAGQICLPGVGAPLMNADCPRAYTHGHWRHGCMLGYTSAGVGCSLLPVRYNCPAEITLIELARKCSSPMSVS
jgi:predicted MPP superfamily phosphohydrolase